jgi:hypothetical protein
MVNYKITKIVKNKIQNINVNHRKISMLNYEHQQKRMKKNYQIYYH